MKDGICLINSKFDINRLEPGIRREVALLRQHSMNTISSCQGGEGHPFDFPTIHVGLKKEDDPRKIRRALHKLLRDNGYPSFTIKEIYGSSYYEYRGDGSDDVWYIESPDIPLIELQFLHVPITEDMRGK